MVARHFLIVILNPDPGSKSGLLQQKLLISWGTSAPVNNGTFQEGQNDLEIHEEG
jgi:hypothetical protein